MSYALSAALQSAVFSALRQDPKIAELVGAHVYDALASGQAPELYISLGPEVVTDASDKSCAGAVHRFTVSVISTAPGFAIAKTVAAAVCDALLPATLTLSRGHLVGLTFERATAIRTDAASSRRIDLRFRARVEDTDLPTSHNIGDDT